MTATDQPETLPKRPAPPRADEDDRLRHLVLKSDWPIALCGARVTQVMAGARAPGADRCWTCLKIANTRGLGNAGSGREFADVSDLGAA